MAAFAKLKKRDFKPVDNISLLETFFCCIFGWIKVHVYSVFLGEGTSCVHKLQVCFYLPKICRIILVWEYTPGSVPTCRLSILSEHQTDMVMTNTLRNWRTQSLQDSYVLALRMSDTHPRRKCYQG